MYNIYIFKTVSLIKFETTVETTIEITDNYT